MIVEIAALVTDANLNILPGSVDLVIHATDEELAEMDDYTPTMHAKNGLTEQIRTSTVTMEQAEQAVLELIDEHCDPAHPAPWLATRLLPRTVPLSASRCPRLILHCITA